MQISPQGHAQLSLSTSQSLFAPLITMEIMVGEGGGLEVGLLIMRNENSILISVKLAICLHFLYQASP